MDDGYHNDAAIFTAMPKMSEEVEIDRWLKGIAEVYTVRLDTGDAACWFLTPKSNQYRYRRSYRIGWSSVIQSALFLLKVKRMGAK